MHFHFRRTLWAIVTSRLLVAGLKEAGTRQQSEDLASVELPIDSGLAASGVPVEYHQVTVTVEHQKPLSKDPWTERHQKEKDRLLERLKRSNGSWSSNHVRHRLLDALHGFARYYDRQKEELDRLRGLYKRISKPQSKLLEHHVHYSHSFVKIDHLLASNQALCDSVVDEALGFYKIRRTELDKHIKDMEAKNSKAEKTSVSQALKHVVRDWTEAGLHERNTTFACIIHTLEKLIPSDGGSEDAFNILLPGAGLGRLGYDVAAAFPGSQVTVNEWSMYMNVMSRFIEKHARKQSSSLHPFVDSWSHHLSAANMQRQLFFPDTTVDTSAVVLVEGDFVTVFDGQAGTYDIIITYFFIDTARNLLSYFDTIRMLLKPGGHWINLGPLLYGSAPFVQLALDDIVTVVEAMGFAFLDTSEGCGGLTWPDRKLRTMEAVYSFDDQALTRSAYKAQFWVAQKV
ncbi:hypothetical protein S40288_00930 [Stachybotrys chartarum IBT 40288]|nr:hypothetical protein S40288_00930 [Stachybotrys chartarum IBT 40288]